MTSTINVTKTIDAGRFGAFQLRVAVLCGILVLLDGFDVQAIAFTAPVIAAHWGLAPAAFGPVFGAGLVGLMIGALSGGPIADLFGRRGVILAATLLFSLFALATPLVATLPQLMLLRFLTGLGLGAVMPNAIALTSEYAPARVRSLAISVMFVGFPFGGVVAGVLGAKLIPAYGWQAMFYFGGALPLIMVPVALLLLPESIRFLMTRSGREHEVARLLARMGLGDFTGDHRFVTTEPRLKGFPVGQLFAGGRGAITVLLWVAFFCNLLVIFFLANWLPAVLRQASLGIAGAALLTGFFHFGGVIGSIVNGRVMDRLGHFRVLATIYLAAAVFVAAIGMAGGAVAVLAPVLFCAGWCVVGGQTVANAIAAALYPTAIRSTGVGWALGIGRIGSIIGPVVGGMLLAAHLGTEHLFYIAALPTIVASLAIALLGRSRKTAGFAAARSAEEASADA